MINREEEGEGEEGRWLRLGMGKRLDDGGGSGGMRVSE